MKFLVILATTLAVARTQRPTYAGLSPKGYPELASRFRDPADDQEDSNSTDVVNRFGGNEEAAQNIPVDARGDINLVNRLNQWPRENRPFWLINAEQIERHRRPSQTANQQNLDTLQLANQQRLNELQSNFDNRNQQMFGGANQRSQVAQARPVVSRLGQSVGVESRTIKPQSQRGSFSGQRS